MVSGTLLFLPYLAGTSCPCLAPYLARAPGAEVHVPVSHLMLGTTRLGCGQDSNLVLGTSHPELCLASLGAASRAVDCPRALAPELTLCVL